MSDETRFAKNLTPPYYAVIFANQLRQDPIGYDETAQRMVELASQQPGYLGAESTRDTTGFGITVSYWQDLEAIKAWKLESEHTLARENGRRLWYQGYELRIAKIEHAYNWRFGESD